MFPLSRKRAFLQGKAGLFAVLLATSWSARADDQSVSIPLELLQVPTGEAGQNTSYKLGIYVGLGGGAPQLYEFDTGGGGFWAAYSGSLNAGVSQWWGSTGSTGLVVSNTYSSGNVYSADVVTTSVQLYSSSTGPATISVNNMGVAQINQGSTKTETPAQWSATVAAGAAPLYQNFYGDFGASLAAKGTSGASSIWSILPQLGGNLSSGFVVQSGGNPYAPGTTAPQLIVGITDAMRAEYPIVLSMSGSLAVVSGGTTWTTYAQQLLSGTMTLSADGKADYPVATGFVTDTGAPSTVIHDDPPSLNVPNRFLTDDLNLKDGTDFQMYVTGTDGEPLLMSFSSSDQASYTEVDMNYSSTDGGYVNTGLNLFFRYNVMYDLQDGVVRLQPIIPVPEPGTIALVTLALAAGGLEFWRRRKVSGQAWKRRIRTASGIASVGKQVPL